MTKGELKNRVRFSTTLDKNIANKLQAYSKKTMIPISKILDIAISNYLENGIKENSN